MIQFVGLSISYFIHLCDEPPIAYAFLQVDDASERFPNTLAGKH